VLDAADLALHATMAGYWTRFAATGKPSADGGNVVLWPAFKDQHGEGRGANKPAMPWEAGSDVADEGRRRWARRRRTLRARYADAAPAGEMFAFNRKKLSGSYFALIVARRAMFGPKAVEASAPAVSSVCPVKFV